MKLKRTCLVIFLFAIILLNLTIINATEKNTNNIDSYFRIHVVANSDSIDDQILKLIISKKVNEYIHNLNCMKNSKNESKQIITDNIYNILKISKDTINEYNKDYNVKAYIGNIRYEDKTYNNFKFDSGVYDSLKIVIGKGKGNNWWSLIYPENIDLDEYLNSETTYSFKIVEIIRNLFNIPKEGIR